MITEDQERARIRYIAGRLINGEGFPPELERSVGDTILSNPGWEELLGRYKTSAVFLSTACEPRWKAHHWPIDEAIWFAGVALYQNAYRTAYLRLGLLDDLGGNLAGVWDALHNVNVFTRPAPPDEPSTSRNGLGLQLEYSAPPRTAPTEPYRPLSYWMRLAIERKED